MARRKQLVVRPILTERGLLLCPVCEEEIATPVAPNPHRGGVVEKMILKGGRGECPVCRAVHVIDAETARRHNAFWFPDYKVFLPPEGY